jgi:hypothetical protein
VLLSLALLGAAGVSKARLDAQALEHDSLIVEGKVLRLWVTTGKGAGRHVAYEYPASLEREAGMLRGETTLSRVYFDPLKEAGPIAVKVCRTNAPNHQVIGEPPRTFASLAAVAIALGLLALVGLAGVVNLLWWWLCRQTPGLVWHLSWSVKRVSWRLPTDGRYP